MIYYLRDITCMQNSISVDFYVSKNIFQTCCRISIYKNSSLLCARVRVSPTNGYGDDGGPRCHMSGRQHVYSRYWSLVLRGPLYFVGGDGVVEGGVEILLSQGQHLLRPAHQQTARLAVSPAVTIQHKPSCSTQHNILYSITTTTLQAGVWCC